MYLNVVKSFIRMRTLKDFLERTHVHPINMVKLQWLGHAAWLVEFSKTRMVIDPFLTNNPRAAMKESDLNNIDYVLVTHTHFDHVGDAYAISRRTGAKIVGMFELSQGGEKDELGEDHFIGMNKGSQTRFGEVSIGLTAAVHSGNESGFVVTGDGKTIYHAGDTALFGDMKYIGELYKPDVALLPTGGFYTMGPREAAVAAGLIKAKYTIPMHYGTFPGIDSDPEEFRKLAGNVTQVKILKPGDVFQIP
jgi:L-ascorbate metabolism protein UlaG (beta-lactamase superfamily)